MKKNLPDCLDIRWSLIWLWVFSLSCVFWLIGRSTDELGILGSLYILACLLVLLVVESLVTWIFYRLVRGSNFLKSWQAWHPVSLFIIGLVLMNQRYFLVPVLDAGLQFKVFALLLVGMASFFALYSPRLRRFLVVFAVLLAAIPWLFGDRPGQHSASVNNVVDVQFQHTKRNVYLLSFDALVSKNALSKLFGHQSLPWSDPLQQLGFRVMENAWSAGDLSLSSFTHMLNMKAVPRSVPRAEFFGGAYANPGYRLYKDNLYGIQFLYHTSYFGYRSGPWIDYFHPPRSLSLCDFIPELYGLFVCRDTVIRAVNLWLNFPMAENQEQEMERIVSKRITAAANDSRRWLTIAYFFEPGHTPSVSVYQYQDTKARQAYIEQYPAAASRAIGIMRRVIGQIQSQDKNAIIFVFGDHGAWVTSGLDEHSADQQQQELIQLDRRGVTFAVFPRDFCVPKFNEGYDLTNLLFHVASCLAADETKQ